MKLPSYLFRLNFKRFRVNRYAMDLGEPLFDAVFEGGRNVMDLCDRQIALHGAVAGGQDAVLYLAHVDVVAIHELIVFGGQRVQEPLDGARELLHFTAADVGGGDVAAQGLDVDVDVDGPIAQLANAVFELGG